MTSTPQATGSLVLIASADATLQRWWSEGLSSQFAVEEISDATSIRSALIRLKPSVLLLDLSLPRLTGLRALGGIVRMSPTTKILVLSDSLDQQGAVAALKAGARGCCSRLIEPSLIRKTIEALQKGELWVKRGVMLALLRELIPLHKRPSAEAIASVEVRLRPLTGREREIAYLVGAGARNKDIAASLDITETTVKAHLTAIFRKLGIPDRLRLALMLSEYDRNDQTDPATAKAKPPKR